MEYPEGTITTKHGQQIPRLQIFRNDALVFSGGYNPDIETSIGRYYNEDGTWKPFIYVRAGYSNDPWYDYEFTENNILFFASGPATSVRGSWAYYFISLFIAALVAVMTALPDTLFYLNHRLYVRDPEPTAFYYAMHNLSSVVTTGMVLVLYILALCQIE